MTRPIMPPSTDRWSGDTRHPTQSVSPTSRSSSFSSANTGSRSTARSYVDFGGMSSNVRASERWSPSNAAGATKATSPSRPTGGRHSDPGAERPSLPSFVVSESSDATAQRGRPNPGAATTRGKRLLRERLRQKAGRVAHSHNQNHNHSPTRDYSPPQTSKKSIASFDTDAAAAATTTMDINTKLLDLPTETHNITTPSTAASSRSPMSRSLSLRQITGTSTSLLSSDSMSPSEMGALSPSSKAISPRLIRSRSLNEGRHRRKENFHSPESTTNHSTLGSPVTFTRQQQQHHPSKLSPPPPPPPGPAPSTTSSASSLRRHSLLDVERTAVAISKSILQQQQRKEKHTATPPSKQHQQSESDEEREKPDSKGQRLAKARSVDKRQSSTTTTTTTTRSNAALTTTPVKMNRIRLHVYDLIAEETIMQLPWGLHFPIGQCFNAVNSGLHTLGTGAYHVGIEINGIEYAYGANSTVGLTGVFTCMPMSSPGYQYRTTIDLGDRALLRKVKASRRGDQGMSGGSTRERYVDGRDVVREMALEYMGLDYDLLRKNCVTFSHDACLRLGVQEEQIPDWFRNLCVAGAAAQDAANSTMEPLSRVFSSCDMDGFTDFVKDNGFEVIADDKRREEIVETGQAS